MRPTLPSTPRSTRRVLALALALTLPLLLAGCGYKGPLYLPESKPAAKNPAPKPVVSPAAAPTDPAATPQLQQTP